MDNTRFRGAAWIDTPQDILQIGLGGIGCQTATNLLACGHKLTIYEFDTIESHNCIPQGYFKQYIGFKKLTAFAAQMLTMFGKSAIKNLVSLHAKFDESSIIKPVTIVAVDNMATRKLAFEKWKTQEDRELFIDGRLLAETYHLFCVQKGQEERYESTLFSDDEVAPTMCTYQQTRYVAGILAGRITQSINNFSIGIDVPFREEYQGILFTLTTQYD